MTAKTVRCEVVAEALGVSPWTLREQVKAGTLPPELVPLRIGRRQVWVTARVESLLGPLSPSNNETRATTSPGLASQPTPLRQGVHREGYHRNPNERPAPSAPTLPADCGDEGALPGRELRTRSSDRPMRRLR